jgi:hypothetical protein
MPPAEFEPTIPASERPPTHALDSTAAGIVYEESDTHTYSRKYSRRYADTILYSHQEQSGESDAI